MFSFCSPSSQGWIQSSSSDLQKSLNFFPNLICQLFVAVLEINYPSCKGWELDVHGAFHKSLKTHFDWSELLALSCELLNSVMIGYSGRKLPWKLLTFIYKDEPLPHSSLAINRQA